MITRGRRSAQLGVGTATFIQGYGIGMPAEVAGSRLVREAIEQGVTYLDTAAAYGEAEVAIGALAALVAERGVRVCTKVAVDPAITVDKFEAAVAASLRRLASPAVDTLLLHSAPAGTIEAATVARACRAIKARGWAARTGASTYGESDAEVAFHTPWCDVVQIEFSILNRSVIGLAAGLCRPGQELVVRSVLCKGLLTSRWRAMPEAMRNLAPTIEALERLAHEWAIPLDELAIRFALDTPGVDIVLVGIGSAEELTTALRARDREPLNGDQIAALAAFDCSALAAAHPERWPHVLTSS